MVDFVFMSSGSKIKTNKTNMNSIVVGNIIKKARDYHKQKLEKPKIDNKPAFVAPDQFPDPMTTVEATKYLRVSKTTLMAYENSGFLKAIRNVLPNKNRGKVTWSKEQLDRVKFGTYKNN
jgi:hypothetical protein